jgi:nucleotide-binding universal stress UspA family protein
MSYRTIFSVVNEHTASTVTARYAIAVAAAYKAELVLYAAHDEGSNEALLLRTNRHLDHLVAIASEFAINVTCVVEVGNISTLLPKRVAADKADLVWYPLSQHERYGAHLRRHTVHHLLRAVMSDLAIMRINTMVKPHPVRILAPLGKVADRNDHRLLFVAALANCFNSQVTLFHLSKERGVKKMPDSITRFREQLQQQQVAVLERHGTGNIAEAIGVEAIARHNDLVVLGASERGALSRVISGNPAGDVMHRPPCNTILFRAGN